MATTRFMTADELAELTGPTRYELLRGELIEMSPTGFEHSDVGNTIAWYLTSHVREQHLGRVTNADAGYRLSDDPDTVFAPDVAFVRADRLPPPAERKGFLPLAPDLVVEVISPSDRASQVAAKINVYIANGVQLVWLVEPDERTVTVYTPDRTARILTADETLDGGEILPGFAVRVGEFFLTT